MAERPLRAKASYAKLIEAEESKMRCFRSCRLSQLDRVVSPLSQRTMPVDLSDSTSSESHLEISLVSLSKAERWRRTWPELPASVLEQTTAGFQRRPHEFDFEGIVAELRILAQTLAASRPSQLIPVQSFGDEPVELLRSFLVVVQPCGDEFTASFVDANFNASGDTEVEAVENLKAVMLDALEHYSVLAESDSLGREPKRQLAVLRQFLRLTSK